MTQRNQTVAEIRQAAEDKLRPIGERRLRLLAELEEIDRELWPLIIKARSAEVSLRRIQALTGVTPNTVRAREQKTN